jgi:gamma-glutamyltranspeptidase
LAFLSILKFYEGETAKAPAAEMERHGVLITLSDLASYQAVEREPLTGAYNPGVALAQIAAIVSEGGCCGVRQTGGRRRRKRGC